MRACTTGHHAAVREATGEEEKGQVRKGPDYHKMESGFCLVGTGRAYNWVRQTGDFIKTGKKKIHPEGEAEKTEKRSVPPCPRTVDRDLNLSTATNYGPQRTALLSMETGHNGYRWSHTSSGLQVGLGRKLGVS